jgi:hypothetical protein
MGRFDPWQVNIDGVYHESGAADPAAPKSPRAAGLPPAPAPAAA